MILITRSVLVAGLLMISLAGASAQPPPNDTVSKTMTSRVGESKASDPTGRTAAATTTKETGAKVDSGPKRDSNGRPIGSDNK